MTYVIFFVLNLSYQRGNDHQRTIQDMKDHPSLKKRPNIYSLHYAVFYIYINKTVRLISVSGISPTDALFAQFSPFTEETRKDGMKKGLSGILQRWRIKLKCRRRDHIEPSTDVWKMSFLKQCSIRSIAVRIRQLQSNQATEQ